MRVRVLLEKISEFYKRIILKCSTAGLKSIVIIALIIVVVALLAVFGILVQRICSLATDKEWEMDFTDASITVSGLDEFFDVATYMPLVQAFTGTSLNLEGATTLPEETTSVSTPDIDLELTEPLIDEGWSFSETYEDESTSVILIEDDEENRIIIAVTETDDPTQFLIDLEAQYVDILPLFGFEVVSSTVEDDSIKAIFEQDDVTLSAEAWVEPEEPDKAYIAVLATAEEYEQLSEEFGEVISLLTM
jgi:hypothetical protein